MESFVQVMENGRTNGNGSFKGESLSQSKRSRKASAVRGTYPDEVYGMFICKDRVSAKTCKNCVTAAITQILVKCPLNNDAIIWFDNCFIQYSNKTTFSSLEKHPSFTTSAENDPYVCMSNQDQSSDQPSWFKEELLAKLDLITFKATSDPSNRMYAADIIETGLANFSGTVQCKSDLPEKDCFDCVSEAADRVKYCLPGKSQGIILTPNCSTRYELNPSQSHHVNPKRPPAPAKGGKERRSKIMISASVSASVLMALLGFCLYYYYCIRSKKLKSTNISSHQETERSNAEFQLLDFDDSLVTENQVDSQDFPLIELDVVHKATQHFSEANKIGEGGFGPVYKGTLIDGKQIAVKRLSRSSGQGMKEFKAEVTLIARLQHRNLVKLLGCSLKNNEMLLVYDYMPNKSLDVFLFGQTPVISSSLLGMARIFGSNQSEANTNRVVGTYGYMAPEYAMEGIFSVKSDVYSFGVLLLEMISGRKNNGFYLSGQGHSLLEYGFRFGALDFNGFGPSI